MAWERRRNGSYYYRKVWRNGTCQTEYIGGGPIAPLAARLDAIEREERTQKRQALRTEQAEQDALDDQIDELGERVQDLMTAVLLATGHHIHNRQWRRARGATK